MSEQQKNLLEKANELAAKQEAEYGVIDPMWIDQVLAVYLPKATYEECREAAMSAYLANRWTRKKQGLCFSCEERANSKRLPKDHAVPQAECTYHESNGYNPELTVKLCDEYKAIVNEKR